MQDTIQGLMFQVYITDVYGTTVPFDRIKDVYAYLTKPEIIKQVGERTHCDDVEATVARGIEQSRLRNKDHPDFKRYVELFEEAAIIGYNSGELVMPLEQDVTATLEQIRNLGGRVRIFSSAGESAKLGMQTNGLDALVDGYHSSLDPSIRTKFAPEAYLEIARQIGVNPKEIVYVADDIKEVEAAVKAGFGKVFLIDRKAPRVDDKDGYTIINNYKQVAELTTRTLQTKPKRL